MSHDGTQRQTIQKHKNSKTKQGGGVPSACLNGLSDSPPAFNKIRMAKQRYINTKFWDDSYIIELIPTEKFLYLYFLTSPLTNIAGIYEISKRRISFDTGLGIDEIRRILKKLENDKKVYYVDGWVIICNFPRYQDYEKSPKIKEGIEIILNNLPTSIKEKIDTLSIPYTYCQNYSNTNTNTNTNSNNTFAIFEKTVFNLWNDFCQKHPSLQAIKKITGTRRAKLKARFEEETFRDFEAILVAIEGQPFLLNGNPQSEKHKDWRVNFDFLITNDTNYIKILEERYKTTKKNKYILEE